MNGLELVCIVFVASASSCYGFCQFPQHLWCSSPEIAKECRVTSQCKGLICLAKVDAKPVDVVVYYEAMCSECIDFVKDHLSLADKEVGEIMNLQLVPYVDTEACIIYLYPNISVHFPLIECMMTTVGLPEDNAKTCALKFGGVDWAEIVKCSRGSLGRRLEHQMGLHTKSLAIPEDAYLPYVTLNGVLVGDVMDKPGTDYVNLICHNYQGPFPYGCRMEKSHPNHSCRKA
ncbi:hypothetical protein ACJMK2_004519 [Sinanodonta woodiana]|uniref:Uncharacterized protein n=1 Tax=Sinanodonta woodiana TaxID=1069815 RepID=A0ABD3Y219_SINWO